jgi:hypothetical protein
MGDAGKSAWYSSRNSSFQKQSLKELFHEYPRTYQPACDCFWNLQRVDPSDKQGNRLARWGSYYDGGGVSGLRALETGHAPGAFGEVTECDSSTVWNLVSAKRSCGSFLHGVAYVGCGVHACEDQRSFEEVLSCSFRTAALTYSRRDAVG